jgi:hypothetical protein
MEENSKWKTLVFVIGGSAGLLAGLAAALIFVRTREKSVGNDRKLTTNQGVRIGLSLVSLLRLIAEGGSK